MVDLGDGQGDAVDDVGWDLDAVEVDGGHAGLLGECLDELVFGDEAACDEHVADDAALGLGGDGCLAEVVLGHQGFGLEDVAEGASALAPARAARRSCFGGHYLVRSLYFFWSSSGRWAWVIISL